MAHQPWLQLFNSITIARTINSRYVWIMDYWWIMTNQKNMVIHPNRDFFYQWMDDDMMTIYLFARRLRPRAPCNLTMAPWHSDAPVESSSFYVGSNLNRQFEMEAAVFQAP